MQRSGSPEATGSCCTLSARGPEGSTHTEVFRICRSGHEHPQNVIIAGFVNTCKLRRQILCFQNMKCHEVKHIERGIQFQFNSVYLCSPFSQITNLSQSALQSVHIDIPDL